MFGSRRFVSIISATALVRSTVGTAESAGKDGDFDAAAMKSIERLSGFIAGTKQFGVAVDVAYAMCGSTSYQPIYRTAKSPLRS